MINIVFTVFSLAILVVAMVSKGNNDMSQTTDTNVLSATVDQTESPTPTPSETPLPIETTTPSPASASATPTATPKPVTTPNTTGSINKSDWIYPHNSDLSQSETTITFKTTDDPKTVVNWYSDKLKVSGFNSRGVIQAKSNEKVHNSVSGGNSHGNVNVDITQENSTSAVVVEVTISGNSSGNSSVNISI